MRAVMNLGQRCTKDTDCRKGALCENSECCEYQFIISKQKEMHIDSKKKAGRGILICVVKRQGVSNSKNISVT